MQFSFFGSSHLVAAVTWCQSHKPVPRFTTYLTFHRDFHNNYYNFLQLMLIAKYHQSVLALYFDCFLVA